MATPLCRIALACGVLFAPAVAADVVEIEVKRDGARFDIRFQVALDAPPEHVWRLMENPSDWAALSRVIRRSERLDEPAVDGQPVEMVFYNCVLFLCMEATKVSIFRVEPWTDAGGVMKGETIPGRGNFRRCSETWRIEPRGAGTYLSLSAALEPDFRVPPIIGPFLLKGMLRTMLGEMEANIERMAERQIQPSSTGAN